MRLAASPGELGPLDGDDVGLVSRDAVKDTRSEGETVRAYSAVVNSSSGSLMGRFRRHDAVPH